MLVSDPTVAPTPQRAGEEDVDGNGAWMPSLHEYITEAVHLLQQVQLTTSKGAQTRLCHEKLQQNREKGPMNGLSLLTSN